LRDGEPPGERNSWRLPLFADPSGLPLPSSSFIYTRGLQANFGTGLGTDRAVTVEILDDRRFARDSTDSDGLQSEYA